MLKCQNWCITCHIKSWNSRWVGEDVPEIKLTMENSGVLSKYDPKSYDSMLELCKTYNKAIDAHLKVRFKTMFYIQSLHLLRKIKALGLSIAH